MGNSEQGKENLRKLQVTGREGESYMIMLPKVLVEKLGWHEGRQVHHKIVTST
jgi:antitoxin component of MazEF toxin-antitoxin module